MHLVLCPERLPPLPLDLSLERERRGGGSVSGHSSVASECAPISSAPSGAGEGEVARSRRTPPARAVSSAAHHSMLRDVMSREKFQRTAPLLDPPVFPDLRSDSSRNRGRRPRSRSSCRSRASG